MNIFLEKIVILHMIFNSFCLSSGNFLKDLNMKSAKIAPRFLMVAFIMSGLLPECLWAELPAPEQLYLSFRQVVKKVKPAVVYIEIETVPQGSAAGSGVIIDGQNGYVLTANHVVEQASQVKVRLGDGREFTTDDIRTDPTIDIAIVKIDADNLPQAQLGDSEQLEVGDWVLAIGSPFGRALENSVSAGIVSAKGRRTGILLGRVGIEDFIQTDAVINKGNSGGPLVNTKGKIVGINSSIISSTGLYAGLGFAVPSKLIKPTVEKLMTEGKVVRGWLGVTVVSLRDLDESRQEKLPEEVKDLDGVYVEGVFPDGPAEKAGLKKDDIILAIDNKQVPDAARLIKIISAGTPASTVKCKILRKGKDKTVKIELGERPTELASEMFQRTTPTQQRQGYKKLGLVVSDFDEQILDRGGISILKAVIVDYVEPGSLADEFGIGPFTIITELDGQKVQSRQDFEAIAAKADVEKGVKLTILGRFGKYQVILKSGAD